MPSLTSKPVGATGYGLMGLTWRPEPAPKEQAFKAMRTALSKGANFWNGGELYGTPTYNSLHLLNSYFTQYPEDAEKVVLSIKGAFNSQKFMPDSSPANVRRSVDECLRVLDGKKFLDLFECARQDANTPVEATVETLAEYVKAGKLGGISLSEVRAETIRRAAKVHPISAVEVELSLWSTDILDNGVMDTCAELGIPIVAYSPLGRGFLTGQIKSIDDIPEGDFRRHMPRFQPDVFSKNLDLVAELQKFAQAKGCTPAQLALAWVKSFSGKPGRPTVIPIPGATTEERVLENMVDVTLTDRELEEIEKILKKLPVAGGRYAPGHPTET
ncbi:Aldo/keto reductase [Xylona heveae TC161]|uniref:Aldo/keto reductase n=1 Tax=Xylona heveae (strain CBS 132557 / TC161) TaxID=1328760 RepID=A0A165GJN3_XYLHT|nr:Aldo/keto reductase [Xylona heveae TC161]KZF22272.1 Aldo/keto reductase [Xylona heveae TC161]